MADEAGASNLGRGDPGKECDSRRTTLCARCRGVRYCCKNHQQLHREQHRKECNCKPELKPAETGQTAKSGATDSTNPEPGQQPRLAADRDVDDAIAAELYSLKRLLDPTSDVALKLQLTEEVLKTLLAVGPREAAELKETDSSLEPAKSDSSAANSRQSGSRSPIKVVEKPMLSRTEGGSKTQQFLPSPLKSESQWAPIAICSGQQESCLFLTPAFAKGVVDSLDRFGFYELDCFADMCLGQRVLQEVRQLNHCGSVQSQPIHSSGSLRGTMTRVHDQQDNCRYINHLMNYLNTVMSTWSSCLKNYIIEKPSEATVTYYPAYSKGYKRHVDNPNQNGRLLTCIYFLNRRWDAKKDGGLLKIYPESIPITHIKPEFNKLVVLWSDERSPHRVLPTFRDRYSIVMWYYDKTERANSRANYNCIYW